MTPAKFLNKHVSLVHDLPDVYRMISSNFIVCDALILTLVTVCKSIEVRI